MTAAQINAARASVLDTERCWPISWTDAPACWLCPVRRYRPVNADLPPCWTLATAEGLHVRIRRRVFLVPPEMLGLVWLMIVKAAGSACHWEPEYADWKVAA